ncbi:MAG: 23S rRNA (pseudouridine(1915)-N(3))-methyltransferase RlmH [Candidatus Altiarchaeota archaeon]|nr:23S rRNA (pseudouridine(1915)-N(3))-methyltransferase RlmH [Candidatus Altiarchaeota archaeon]
MKIICPSKTKSPYTSVIDELSKRARVSVEFVKKVEVKNPIVLDEQGETLTIKKLSSFPENTVFVIGGPDGTSIEGLKYSLGQYTLNHQIAIIVLLELLFRAKNPSHPYNKH